MQSSINKVKKVVTTRRQYLKWPFKSREREKQFCNRTIAIEGEICRTSINKLIDTGTSILDLSKGVM